MNRSDLGSILKTLPSISGRSNNFDPKQATYSIAVERINELLLQYIRVERNFDEKEQSEFALQFRFRNCLYQFVNLNYLLSLETYLTKQKIIPVCSWAHETSNNLFSK